MVVVGVGENSLELSMRPRVPRLLFDSVNHTTALMTVRSLFLKNPGEPAADFLHRSARADIRLSHVEHDGVYETEGVVQHQSLHLPVK